MDNSESVRERIITSVVDSLKNDGKYPASVYRLCQDLSITEKAFFSEFSNFEAVESQHWRNIMDHNIRCVESGQDWSGYNAHQRLLAFYYAYFDDALCHRSLLLLRFAGKSPLQPVRPFQGAEDRFRDFAGAILRKAKEEALIADRGRLGDFYPQAMQLHLRFLMDYHLRDESPGFEKTDALIEKSVRLLFDLLKTSAVESALDLARWLHSFKSSSHGAGSSASCGKTS